MEILTAFFVFVGSIFSVLGIPCLQEYDDDYVELPRWDRTITDVEEEKLQEKKRRDNAKKGKFGSAAGKINLD